MSAFTPKVKDVDNVTVTYTYDELGRLTRRTLNATAEGITFDALGRATAATNALGSFGTGYVNATERPQTVTFPNNQTTTYTYHPNTAPAGTGNGDQRLQTIWHQDAAAATISKHDYSYDPSGEITGWTQQAGATPATAYGYEYDRASQLLAATRQDAATNAVQKQYTYRYDLAGNRTLEQIDSSVSSAAYNSVNQLTARTGAGPMVFEGTVNKDATVTVGGISATVNGQNRFTAQVYVQPGQQSIEITARDTQGRQTAGHAQVTVEAGAINPTVTYDPNGNQTADGARTYDWDAANRLVKITQGGSVREFAYNGFGQRMSEKVNGTLIHRWLWDGPKMLAELDASNAVTKCYFQQGFQTLNTQQSTLNLFYTRDHLGSIREVTDATNTLRARYDYDPWGRRSANLVTANPVESDFGYTGHYFDAPTGMHVAYYRWLESGRWLSRDPIGEEGGLNLYGYVLNNPLSYFDPDGRDIAYANHPVMLNKHHSKIIITPNNQEKWSKDPRFQNHDKSGKCFATIGAGPDKSSVALSGGVNRQTDVTGARNNYQNLSIPSHYNSEDQAIESLFQGLDNYNNNTPLIYDLFPSKDGGGYNSNGFVSGLLGCKGFSVPNSGANTPGYNVPVPSGNFR